jgi:ribonuclease P protein component
VDFQRVHAVGRSWSDRRLVLCALPNDLPNSRFGFSVSRRIGKAVVRNRTKRLLRAVVRVHCDLIAPGWDVVFIARRGIVGADYCAIKDSVQHLLTLAHLDLGLS